MVRARKRELKVEEGSPYPLGAVWDGLGVNFALFSQHAEKVELCLFDSPTAIKETHRVELFRPSGDVWHCYLPEAFPEQVYGYRVYGPYAPEHGHRFNPNKLVLDPYAKRLARGVTWDKSMFGYQIHHRGESRDLTYSDRDSAPHAPLASVVDTAFSWGDDVRPKTPWNKTVIYEAHVKGLTAEHPGVSPELRGTYAGVASEAVISHLQSLGVTALELMPIQQGTAEWHLVQKGLTNYWGYSTLGYFAPDIRFASNPQSLPVDVEFKSMVRALHSAGIEVILDVVYNHTTEGNQLGPTLCFRGIDNASYYRLVGDNARYYMDYTGCGNTLNTQHPRALQLIMDSLRYWVEEMHVDGFRFDLASTLAREEHAVDMRGGFLDIISQDPVLSQVKLIAEPWDLGDGGYQVGGFPAPWSEWNDKYRATLRRFWKGDAGTLGELATRISGSSDLYQLSRRGPRGSVNFITSHDGFTLKDLVSYNEKHNKANGENNHDGENHNLSWNCGVEGATNRRAVNELRRKQRKNLMASLLLSAGVPMISGGDELGRSQRGNNNAYCQDNRTSWTRWKVSDFDKEFLQFTAELSALRRRFGSILQRDSFFSGTVYPGLGLKDIAWFNADGEEMTASDWVNPEQNTLGVCFSRPAEEQEDYPVALLILMNAQHKNVAFVLPKCLRGNSWEQLIDTSEIPSVQARKFSKSKKYFYLEANSLAVLTTRIQRKSRRGISS